MVKLKLHGITFFILKSTDFFYIKTVSKRTKLRSQSTEKFFSDCRSDVIKIYLYQTVYIIP